MMKKGTKDIKSSLLKWCVYASAGITVGVLVLLILYIFMKGVTHITPSLFAWEYTSENVSMTPALINTIILVVLTLLFSVPFGVFAAIYLTEYAKKGNKMVYWIRMTTETLAGIPSIVFGLFGYLFFVLFMDFGYSLLAGTFTLAIMVLPTIMRTTEEALKSVDNSYREASFGLGAGHLRTIFRVVLPTAMPGILSGVILSIGRIVGETAALIYTTGTSPEIFSDVFASGRSLSLHMYVLLSEALYMDQAYATAVVLLILVLGINFISNFIGKRMIGGNNRETAS